MLLSAIPGQSILTTNMKGYYRKGVALDCLGRYAEAVDAFRKALALEPSDNDIKRRLSEAQQILSNKEKKGDLMTSKLATYSVECVIFSAYQQTPSCPEFLNRIQTIQTKLAAEDDDRWQEMERALFASMQQGETPE